MVYIALYNDIKASNSILDMFYKQLSCYNNHFFLFIFNFCKMEQKKVFFSLLFKLNIS